ncbi:hypothetical protein WS58_01815 [Burkholderia pseudomultivorans]|nr:hypothetical protein WS57_03475 [Burkholderia pseudomultivorans]KVC24575.1 hypothetical protein WS56_29455 [Burkholderia pseudomultivorans]KVC36941.1 hypothetical protein WS58_01815 [Burkholderia pseudomultivorans]KVC38067.1 hypothetical protein WS55_28155 [Burkholderia pseudomultivorans]
MTSASVTAQRMATLLESMSGQRHQKIDEAFRKNVNRYIDSDAFEAMRTDVEMFGHGSFSKRGEKNSTARRTQTAHR